MANKRTFKKAVNTMSAAICEEMMFAFVNEPKADQKKISEAVGQVLEASESALDNSNVKFDRGVKAFASLADYSKAKADFFKALFNKIISDYNTAISVAMKTFNEALPQEVKDQQKASVAK